MNDTLDLLEHFLTNTLIFIVSFPIDDMLVFFGNSLISTLVCFRNFLVDTPVRFGDLPTPILRANPHRTMCDHFAISP